MEQLITVEKNGDDVVFIDNGLLNYLGFFDENGEIKGGCILTVKDIIENTKGIAEDEMKELIGVENFEIYFKEVLKHILYLKYKNLKLLYKCEEKFPIKPQAYYLNESWHLVFTCYDLVGISGSFFFVFHLLPIKINDNYLIDYSYIEAIFKIATYCNIPNNDNKAHQISSTYLMYDPSIDMYKIGKSIDTLKRERVLMGVKPTINLLMQCDENIETNLHRLFKEKRVRGEWFNLNADDILLLIEQYNFKKVDK